jgi:hypothetical protein
MISAVWPTVGFAGSNVHAHLAGVIFWASPVNPEKPNKSKMIIFSFIRYNFKIASTLFLKNQN